MRTMSLSKGEIKTISYGYIVWALVAIFYGLDYLQHTVPSVLIGPLSQATGTSYINIADIMSVYFPVYALAQIPAGYLIDRFGLRKAMSVSCLCVSLGLFLMLIPGMLPILFGRILIGVGSAFAFIGALKAASLWISEKVFPIMVGLIQTIGIVGGIIGQVFINHLISQHGWHYAIYSIGVFGLLWSAILFFFVKNKRIQKNESRNQVSIKKSLLAIIKDKKVWGISIYAALMVGAVMSTFADTYNILFLERSAHVSGQLAANVSSFIFIGVGVGAPLHGYISKHLVKLKTWILIACGLTALMFALVIVLEFFTVPVALIAIVFFLLGFFVSSMLLSFTLVRDNYPETHHGTLFAFVNMMIGIGGVILPVTIGELIKLIHAWYPEANELLFALLGLTVPLALAFVFATKIKMKQVATYNGGS